MSEIFEGQHNFICGMTGTGKTTFVLAQLEKSSYPVFFFNVQGFENCFCNCNGDYEMRDIVNALRHGEKLNFVPNPRKSMLEMQINYIIDELFAVDCFAENPFYFVIDEAHIVCSQGGKNDYVNMIPTRGRTKGFMGIFIAQRPALVDKTIITQCTKHIIFSTEFEQQYFRTKGLDDEKIKAMLGDDIHNYIIYERGSYSGAFKEKI